MPQFLLHAVWPTHEGCHFWVEEIDGHRILSDYSQLDFGSDPSAIEQLRRHFRAGDGSMVTPDTARVTLRTPKGRLKVLSIPTFECRPSKTIDILTALADAGMPCSAIGTQENRVGADDTESKTSRNANLAMAPDCAYILQLFRGVVRMLESGRVLCRSQLSDGDWCAKWYPADGIQERSWMASMTHVVPYVLTAAGGPRVVEFMAEELATAAAIQRLSDSWVAKDATHSFTQSLCTGSPIPGQDAHFNASLQQWRQDVNESATDLVFMLGEPGVVPLLPNAEDTDGDAEMEAELARQGLADTIDRSRGADRKQLITGDDVNWPLMLAYREGNEAPKPIPADNHDRVLRDRVDGNIARAAEAFPELAHYEREPEQFRYYLTADEMRHFISSGVPRLRSIGFHVLLPAEWAKRQIRVHASVKPRTVAASEDSKTVGWDSLMEFNWTAHVDGQAISETEWKELLSQSSELVYLRNHWVEADLDTLRKVHDDLQHAAELGVDSDMSVAQVRALLMRLRTSLGEEEVESAEEANAGESSAIADSPTGAGSSRQRRGAQGSGIQVQFGGGVSLSIQGASADESSAADGTYDAEAAEDQLQWIAALTGVSAEGPMPTESIAVPAQITATLRDYQQRGLNWLVAMSRRGVGAVVADDMGLGKTLQLICLIAHDVEVGITSEPTLVICPTSVAGNWGRELQQWAPDLRVYLHHGGKRQRPIDDESTERLQELFGDYDVVITSYAIALKDQAAFVRQWHRLVVDEAQHIKNPGTKQSKAIRTIPAQHVVAVTGTPVENRLDELWSVMDLTNPGILGTQSAFTNSYAIPIERYHNAERAEDLRRLTSPFIMRRLKSDKSVISDLPEKNEHIVWCQLSSEQAALYQSAVNAALQAASNAKGRAQRTGRVLSLITALKQICNHPRHYLHDDSAIHGRHYARSGKLMTLLELLDQAFGAGRKVLIFTQYAEFGHLLQEILEKHYGQDIPFLYGATERNRRDAMVKRFNEPDGPDVMLLSLKAGGVGLNLTAASVVIHMDRWWNPAVENQATDRAYRIGQGRNVDVYKLATEGTVEERIHDIMTGKSELAAAVVGSGEGWITQLSDADLAALTALRTPPKRLPPTPRKSGPTRLRKDDDL